MYKIRFKGIVKDKLVGLITVALILAVIISPALIWQFKPEKALKVTILDKTVPQNNYREHKGLVWLLNNHKFVKPNGADYEVQDYYGFFPKENERFDIRPLPARLDNPDLIYVADTYGVYYRDFYTETKNLAGERSKIIYGGTTQQEVNSIANAVNSGSDTTLVVEFNSFATPTEDSVRRQMYEILGVEWTGWVGRHFSDLKEENEEIPRWVFRNYENQYNQKWNFKGEGFVLVKEDDTLVVLEKKDINENGFLLRFTDTGKEMFNVERNIGYYYWFDVVKSNNARSLANFHFDLKEEGKKKLAQFGIPEVFPAVTLNSQQNYKAYYFAGDYIDKNNFPSFYQAVGLTSVNSFLTPDTDNMDSFFWKVYTPVMEKILFDTYEKKEQQIANRLNK